MRVGLDVRFIGLPGVGRYTRCLIQGLSAYRDHIELVLYCRPETDTLSCAGRRFDVPVKPYTLREQVYWPYRIAKDRLDVFHAPTYVFPILSPCPLVVTLHDLVYLIHPPEATLHAKHRSSVILFRQYYRMMNRLAAYRASGIVTVSHFTGSELTRLLKLDPAKLTVIPNAVGERMCRPPEAALRELSERLGIVGPYCLYVGTNKPWKNLGMLVTAFQRAATDLGDCELVIAGKQGKNEERFRDLLNRVHAPARTRLLGEVEERDLPGLYSAAEMVLCPSRHEGFGLTALEAMACGTPVIASPTGGLPEVVGDAALLVAPDDRDAWSKAMIRLHHEESLKTALGEAGRKRARDFSVDIMAERTVRVYRDTLGERP